MTTRVRCTNMFHFDAKNRHIYTNRTVSVAAATRVKTTTFCLTHAQYGFANSIRWHTNFYTQRTFSGVRVRRQFNEPQCTLYTEMAKEKKKTDKL